jgi:DNA-directed RNA polymerase specialized sigma subunit, sigma54 homolog
MNIGSSLSLEQKQQLRLNTRMLQSLQLMTLPIADLQMTVNEALESNPVLVQSAPKGSPSYLETQAHTTEKVSASGYEASDKFSQWMENAVAEEETLQDHLMKQLGCVKTDTITEGVARIIISNLDKNGFHSTPPILLLKTEEEKASLNKALALVQSFDPEGVGVSDYKESLIVQAKALGIKGEEEKAFEGLVNNELEKMRAGKKAEVAKDLGIELEDLDALFEFLKTLTPYPGLKYSSSPDVYIVPDLSIRRDGENLVMQLNSEADPLPQRGWRIPGDGGDAQGRQETQQGSTRLSEGQDRRSQ